METTVISSRIPSYTDPADGWDTPLSLQNPKLPRFPSESFPDMIQRYIEALAENTQTPVDMAGTVVLTIIAAIMQGHYRVQVKN